MSISLSRYLDLYARLRPDRALDGSYAIGSAA